MVKTLTTKHSKPCPYPGSLYRPCVGIMLINKHKQVFVGKRASGSGINTWQMPQGGINQGETITEAGLRELNEETGVQNIRILAEAKDWLCYDLPQELVGKVLDGNQRGQQQKWLLALFLGNDADVNITKQPIEFIEWKWLDIAKLPEVVVHFKKDVYLGVMKEFCPIINALTI